LHQLSSAFNSIQKWLIPNIEDEIGTLSAKQTLFVNIVEFMDLDQYSHDLAGNEQGRPNKSRQSLLKAFIAKAVYNLATTKVLIEYISSSPALRRLCGWECIGEIPSESTFSRAFQEFSDMNIGGIIHGEMTSDVLEEEMPHHASKDSTPIAGREKACRKNTPKKKSGKKRGRPKKGEESPKVPRRVELQPGRSLEENLEDLPEGADWGAKKDSKGSKMKWCGYKLHLDCIDGDIPVSAILTSASVHDSQVAIPLMQMTKPRVTNLYDLMDAAYDSPEIHNFSKSMDHVPIIDPNKRKKDYKELDAAKKKRYNERSTAERVNADLKDNHGGRTVRVKGHAKVFTHLMFGILVITAKQLLAAFS